MVLGGNENLKKHLTVCPDLKNNGLEARKNQEEDEESINGS